LDSTDIIHEFGTHEEWNESFYFNFYDRGQDICGFMRIGLKPNKKEKSVFCFLMMPDGNVFGLKDQAVMENNDLEAVGLKFSKLVDDKKWRLEFNGELPKMAKEGEKEKVTARASAARRRRSLRWWLRSTWSSSARSPGN
jgi:hypothetical protein